MPTAQCRPVPVSAMVGPGLIGGPPGRPVMLIAPPVARAAELKLL